MNRVLLVLVVLAAALTVFAGADHKRESPEAVVAKYLAAIRGGDHEGAYAYISQTDETILEFLVLLRYIKREAPAPLVSAIDRAHTMTRQRIVKTTVEGDKAVVEVDSVVPNIEKAIETAAGRAAIEAMFTQGTVPMMERHGVYELAVEDGRWRITRVRGVSGEQAAEMVIKLADKILDKKDAAELKRKIEDFQRHRGKRGM